MKKLQELNPNTRTYWNFEYENEQKRRAYASQGKVEAYVDGFPTQPTWRFYKAVEFIKGGYKVLDIGCGVGQFTKLLKDMKPMCEVWGVDISDKVIEDNKKERDDITYLKKNVGNMSDLPLDFDVVFSGEVLEHLSDPHLLFLDAYTHLNVRGKFILTTPLRNAVQSIEHMWEFNKEDVLNLYEDHGFIDVQFVDLPDGEDGIVIFAVGVKE